MASHSIEKEHNMKPMLITAYSMAKVGHALPPSTERGVGNQLWKMLNSRTTVTMEQYRETFDRRGLVYGTIFDPISARVKANEIVKEIQNSGRTVVLLGNNVREVFNIPPLFLHPQELWGCTWRQIPVPYVHSRWYNEPENRALIELLLEELYVNA